MADLQAFSESDLLGLALGVARGAWRLRPLIGAGEPVLLVIKVLALVAGAGAERPGLVAVGIVADGERADRRRCVGTRRSGRRIAVGKVVGRLRIDRAVLHRGLVIVLPSFFQFQIWSGHSCGAACSLMERNTGQFGSEIPDYALLAGRVEKSPTSFSKFATVANSRSVRCG